MAKLVRLKNRWSENEVLLVEGKAQIESQSFEPKRASWLRSVVVDFHIDLVNSPGARVSYELI